MATQHDTLIKTHIGGGAGDNGFQVVLHNDNHNAFDFVVMSLMRIFGHSEAIAFKIAHEAHNKGKAVAEVEDERSAMKHCLELRLYGLGADVERI